MHGKKLAMGVCVCVFGPAWTQLTELFKPDDAAPISFPSPPPMRAE